MRSKSVLVVVAILLGGYLGYSIVGTKASEQQAQDTAGILAAPVAETCDVNPAVRVQLGQETCETARRVVADPAIPTPTPEPGRDGEPGRGIVSTEVRADGHLVLTFSDGSTQDAGPVVGGKGDAGTAGVGVISAQTVDGRLILTFSDGSVVDVGRVVGAPGRGVDSTAVLNGRLVVTYSDGTTEDAGPLPMSPPAPPAAQLVINRTDGTTVTCDRTGGDDSAPVYTCRA